MKLRFYATHPDLVDLRPNDAKRDWMDATNQAFAYRCLPLTIANAHGWSMHLKHGFRARWNGTNRQDAIEVVARTEAAIRVLNGGFGHGILTFHVHGVFQTDPGWNLLASGPPNTPKDALYPLTGIMETDWSPYSFTMNWQFTRPNTWVEFKDGEAFCSVFPVERGVLEGVEPELLHISDNAELQKEHAEWSARRRDFIRDLADRKSDAVQEKWQKSYYLGERVDGSKGVEDHAIKLRLKPFKTKSTGDS